MRSAGKRVRAVPSALAAALLLSLGATPLAQESAGKDRAVVRGKIVHGTLDSAVGEVGFLTDSPAGMRIFEACKADQECEIEARLDGHWVAEVYSARPVTE